MEIGADVFPRVDVSFRSGHCRFNWPAVVLFGSNIKIRFVTKKVPDPANAKIFIIHWSNIIFYFMRDAVSIQRVRDLHPKVSIEVAQTIGEIEAMWPPKVAIRIVQGLRTIEEQNNLYALGRTKVNPDGKSAKKPLGNIVTKAKGGSSYHNFGLAFDFALLFDLDGNGTYETLSWDEDNPYWKQVVQAFELKGWFWGGQFSSFKDYPHLQKTFGFNWRELLVKYNKKDFITGTTYVNL